MTLSEVQARLREHIKRKYGSQRVFAEHHGVSKQYVSQILRKRSIPKWLLNDIGIRRDVVYTEIEPCTPSSTSS